MRLVLLPLALVAVSAFAETINISITNIPASATKLVVWVDGGAISGRLPAIQNFAAGTSSLALRVGVPAGGPYRVRTFASTAGWDAPLLRSGQAGGISVGAGATVAASISLGDVIIALDPSVPNSASAGSSVFVKCNITDPGDVIEGEFPYLYWAQVPFSISQGGEYGAPGSLSQSAPGKYQAGFSINLPVSGSQYYYSIRIYLPETDDLDRTALYGPDPKRSSTPWQMTLTQGAAINVTVANLPPSATKIVAWVDGSPIAGTLSAIYDVLPGTSSKTLAIGVPAGGPYRVRAFASTAGWDAPLLRSGQAGGITVAAGARVATGISLADITWSLDAGTPTAAGSGSGITLKCNFTDAGDVIEGQNPSLYWAQLPFVPGQSANYGGLGTLIKLAPGSYGAAITTNLPATGSAYYYVWKICLPAIDGNNRIALYGPNPGRADTTWQITLVPGSAINLTLANIPPAATKITIWVDGSPIVGVLSSVQDIVAGASSKTLSIGVPAGGPYRVRAFASAAGWDVPLLRSGQVNGIRVADGATASAGISVGDLLITLDPSTPASASAGSPVTLTCNIIDPGDIIEGQDPFLYWAGIPFALIGGGQSGTWGSLSKLTSGSYTASIRTNLPTAGQAYYYAVKIPLPEADELNRTVVYGPDPNATAKPWQIALGVSCSYSLTPASKSLGAGAYSSSVAVVSNFAACPWNAQSSVSWIRVSSAGTQNSGTGSISYTVSPNATGAPRTGRILIGGMSAAVTQIGGVGQITNPAPGSSLSGTSATFSWTELPGADSYWLDIGNSVGNGDLSAGALSATSKSIGNLPCDGRTIFVRLWTQVGGVWEAPVDYTFRACTIANAQMLTPVPGSTFSGTTVTFSWSSGSGVTAYWLDVGNSQGIGDIYAANQGTATLRTVAGVPADGRKIYVRLWSLLNGIWRCYDYAYLAATRAKAAMVSPTPSSALAGSSVTFTWTTGAGVSAYWLDVGTFAGIGDIYGAHQGTATSRTVTGIPTDGRTIRVRLWSQIDGSWQFNDYVYAAYTAAGTIAVLLSPPSGSRLSGSVITFTWSAASGATAYWLDVGPLPGIGMYFGKNLGLATSQTVSGIPLNGSLVYVRLWTLIAGAWKYNDYGFVADDSAQVTMLGPAPGSTLSDSSVTFTWSAVSGAAAYWLDVGPLPGIGLYFGQNVGLATSKTVNTVPLDGSTVYVRVWALVAGIWQFNDFYYTAASQHTAAALLSPAPGSTLSGSTVTFTWSAGVGATAYWLDVGTVQGIGGIFAKNVGLATSETVSGIPTGGTTIYIRLWTLLDGIWHFRDYSFTAAH